jgi:hypothetical protein
MKTKDEIEKILMNIPTGDTNYPGMTYENGVEEALRWVLEEIEDEEFEYCK